mmetsp:Transcript_28980/g.39805  ORF Transcript_28980/g.39805 Transcript_28980/m.39805 type:complete len:201 (-) Transcript_28980:61-663(-)|eukprot:CAMPEP_0170108392 /NCGR_PEP_ID=MMETSP0020_2-20130122/6548_1 /TAXON_ID=98059 /ORGANISM="Dinobryon sp., Strain UTEXLB2267" /LENGTH=200 /DNA_ID=CAMNT_0010333113 /DNA_START=792 /DNA_END=1394 /DNA_ORIENTATION=-
MKRSLRRTEVSTYRCFELCILFVCSQHLPIIHAICNNHDRRAVNEPVQSSVIQPTDSWTRIVSRANSHNNAITAVDKDRDLIGDVGERMILERSMPPSYSTHSSTEFGNPVEDTNNMITHNRMQNRGSKQLNISDSLVAHRGGYGRKIQHPPQQHQSLGPQWSNSSEGPLTHKNNQKLNITAVAGSGPGQEKRSSFFDAV